MSKPLFTVATITYNSSKWVRQAIESVLASSYSDFEYIISDDSSTDDTWDIINEYKDPRIRAWRNEINIGEYPNRNKVLNQSNGKYLIYVDGDDILYHNTLRNMSEYISSFPTLGMIWGLNPQHFPFYVFPYLVESSEIIKLIYKTNIPISNIGFGEIVFKTDLLKSKGGLSQKYISGDTYIKKKLAFYDPVLFVSIGMMFWRESPNQASKKLSIGLSSFFERISIDNDILNDPDLPLTLDEKKSILQSLKISNCKLFVSSTILKGDLLTFLLNFKKTGLGLKDLKLLFKKRDLNYSPAKSIQEPLFSNYNFIKK